MSVIYARNFATGTQNYLNLTVNDYLRPISISNNWNRIRIGMLCALGTVYETTFNIRNCSAALGISSGIRNSIGVQAPSHFIGTSFPQIPATSTTGSFTYNAGTAGNSYYTTTGFSATKYTAGVLSSASVGSFTTAIPSNTTLGGALARRGIYILDISKSALVSGNITQGMTCGAVAHMALDITTDNLYTALEWYTTAPVIQGTALTTLGLGNSLAFNEVTNGILDTVCLYWSMLTVPLQLYEIAVYRVG